MTIELPDGTPKPICCYHPNDTLAQIIVEAWLDPKFKKDLLDRKKVRAVMQKRGLCIDNPIVIEESDYWSKTHRMSRDRHETYLVLPHKPGKDCPHLNLLETARLLMCCCPEGI